MVRVGLSRQAVHTRGIGCAIAMLGVLAAGCKSGSWGAKPSWWSFGGTAETSSLATAPSFDKDVVKPSEAAKPYPTTSTPDGYALTGATATDPGRQAAGAAPGLVAPSTVTYGTTSPATPPAQPSPAATAAAAPTAIGPQVGPYAGIQPQPQQHTPPPPGAIDPAAAATAGLAAAPAFGAAEAPLAQPPAARYADARPVEAWAASPPPPTATQPPPAAMQPAPAAAVTGDSRYGQATGSRFGAPTGFEPPPAAAPLEPAWTAPPATTAPTTLPPPAAGGAQLPGGMTPPQRRPDPGYRPGGTSSYRPSRTILASDEPPAAGVTPASFEAPAAGR
jgi:hypothetical protein